MSQSIGEMVPNADSYPDQVHKTIHIKHNLKKISGRIFIIPKYSILINCWTCLSFGKADVGISSKFISFMTLFCMIICRVQMATTTADRRTKKKKSYVEKNIHIAAFTTQFQSRERFFTILSTEILYSYSIRFQSHGLAQYWFHLILGPGKKKSSY